MSTDRPLVEGIKKKTSPLAFCLYTKEAIAAQCIKLTHALTTAAALPQVDYSRRPDFSYPTFGLRIIPARESDAQTHCLMIPTRLI